MPSRTRNTPQQVLFASLVGTTVEFFDFYIFATATVLVFPHLFFPAADATASTLSAFAAFGAAFLARPIGSAIFGHFGDRIGRKRTLVAALLTMGLSTFLIGMLPGYSTLGVLAPMLLVIFRCGQGIGLGGEWGGAVLLAVENAPPRRRALYGMFPQLGAPLGFLLSGGTFLLLTRTLSNAQFLGWGWRLPFLLSSILVLLGLYVRLTITETPEFTAALARSEQVSVPFLSTLRSHTRALIAGTLLSLATFVLFYLMTVFTLSWATTNLGFNRSTFLLIQLFGMLFFALGIPLSALAAERLPRRFVMIAVTVLIAAFGLLFAPLFRTHAVLFMVAGLLLMGFTYGPLGTVVSELFPTPVRYTGSSVAFSMAGVLGASIAPYLAIFLAKNHGLPSVGLYLTATALLTLLGLLLMRPASPEVSTTPVEL